MKQCVYSRIELPCRESYWFLVLRWYPTMHQALVNVFLQLISTQHGKRKSHNLKQNEK